MGMEKRLYGARRPEYPPDHNDGRRIADYKPLALTWTESVFPDDADTETKLEYLREFALTIRENIKENASMARRLEAEIKRIENDN